ncbi:MAG: hypothetical protein SPI18_09720 [Prevotella sp.]|nr:hypothetical protein [Prevotella sp.]
MKRLFFTGKPSTDRPWMFLCESRHHPLPFNPSSVARRGIIACRSPDGGLKHLGKSSADAKTAEKRFKRTGKTVWGRRKLWAKHHPSDDFCRKQAAKHQLVRQHIADKQQFMFFPKISFFLPSSTFFCKREILKRINAEKF